MIRTFLAYFTKYIFFSRTRQRLLFLALFGLFLSSFSLIILQSVMKGLQSGVIQRSKDLQGTHQILLNGENDDLIQILKNEKVPFLVELELEILLKDGSYLAPTIIHGIDFEKSVLPNHLVNVNFKEGIAIGSELFRKLKTNLYSEISLISPAHTDSLLGEIPRKVTTPIEEILYSSDSEYDQFHSFVRLSLLQNLIREKKINKIQVFNFNPSDELLTKIRSLSNVKKIKTWEDVNHSLVWALNLENYVMIGLFVGMSILVAVSITSGFILFFDKIRNDLLSFWLMGLSMNKIKSYSVLFLSILSAFISLSGTLTGVWILKLFEAQKLKILPAVFLEQHLPILIESKGLILSFFIPYLICLLFSVLVFKGLNNDDKSYLTQLRSQGD